MAKFDLENFRDYFVSLFQVNLGTKLAEINAEKSDSIVLADFTSDQYFSDMNAKVSNYSKFIFYGFTDILTIPNPRGGFALDVTIAFDIVFSEPEGGTISENMIIRYTRALAEIVSENATRNPQIQDVEVQLFAPASFADNATSDRMKIGGIQIKGTIG
jgi:hypothetical protein